MIDVNDTACFNGSRGRRYWLRRTLITGQTGRPLKPMVFIGYNPSVADEVRPDPTIKRMMGFAVSHGCSDLGVVNIFSWVTPYPERLIPEDDDGAANDRALRVAAGWCRQFDGIMVAAWGAPKGGAEIRAMARARHNQVLALNLPLHVLDLSAEGYPRHPLYLRQSLRVQKWGSW